QRADGNRKSGRAAEVGRVAISRGQESWSAMLGEDRERPSVVRQVADTEPIVGDERLQRRREIGEEGSRLKLAVERPRDRLETDSDVGFRRRRRPVWRSRMHARAPGGILSDNAGARCLRTRPLSLAQTPASPKPLVAANMAEEAVTTNLRECALGRVELLLGLEHLEIIGQSLAIAVRRAIDGVRERLHRPVLSYLCLAQLAQRGEGAGDTLERGGYRLLVLVFSC